MKAVSAEQYREALSKNAFINGLASPLIRQHLLENKTLGLQAAYDQAYSLDLAQRSASSYSPQSGHTAAAVTLEHAQVPGDDAVKDRPMCETCETTEN